jgi:hypothetical protein
MSATFIFSLLSFMANPSYGIFISCFVIIISQLFVQSTLPEGIYKSRFDFRIDNKIKMNKIHFSLLVTAFIVDVFFTAVIFAKIPELEDSSFVNLRQFQLILLPFAILKSLKIINTLAKISINKRKSEIKDYFKELSYYPALLVMMMFLFLVGKNQFYDLSIVTRSLGVIGKVDSFSIYLLNTLISSGLFFLVLKHNLLKSLHNISIKVPTGAKRGISEPFAEMFSDTGGLFKNIMYFLDNTIDLLSGLLKFLINGVSVYFEAREVKTIHSGLFSILLMILITFVYSLWS